MYQIVEAILWRILNEYAPNFEYGRTRGISIKKDSVCLTCRNGGGNRQCYCDDHSCTGCIQANIPRHPLYRSDNDQSFDYTYCDNHFKIPEKYRELLMYLREVYKQADQGKLPKISKLKELISSNSLFWRDISEGLAAMKANLRCNNWYAEALIDKRIRQLNE